MKRTFCLLFLWRQADKVRKRTDKAGCIRKENGVKTHGQIEICQYCAGYFLYYIIHIANRLPGRQSPVPAKAEPILFGRMHL